MLMTNEQEEQIACPSKLSWLKAMSEILPPEVFGSSKLGKFKNCLEEEPHE